MEVRGGHKGVWWWVRDGHCGFLASVNVGHTHVHSELHGRCHGGDRRRHVVSGGEGGEIDGRC